MTDTPKDRKYAFYLLEIPSSNKTSYRFVYQSNNQSVPFQHWGSFSDTGVQPNNYGGYQHCVVYQRATPGASNTWKGYSGMWNDEKCYGDFAHYICEQRIHN